MTAQVTFEDVKAAAQRIQPYAHVTPIMTSSTFNQLASCELHFKCELFQKIGAFKFRGAMNAVQCALQRQKEKENEKESSMLTFITHSSGNHAQALALAAKITGHNAVIVMPENSSIAKKEAVKGYGATIVECPNTQADRERCAKEQLQRYSPNSILIPPYDHVDVIAGQGTIAYELLQQVPTLDAIVIPVGGGGMLSGICIAAKAIKPNIRIFAAEPLAANDCAQSLEAGERVPLKAPSQTVADGLRVSIGELTWPIIKANVEEVLTVQESDIVRYMKLVWERMKICIEPSAAVGVAAVMGERFQAIRNNAVDKAPIQRVGIILCGGNVDLNSLPW